MTEVCIKCTLEENVDNYVGSTTEMINVNPRTPYQQFCQQIQGDQCLSVLIVSSIVDGVVSEGFLSLALEETIAFYGLTGYYFLKV